MSAITSNFNGQEGTVALWVRSIDADNLINLNTFDWHLFKVKAEFGTYSNTIDIFIPDVSETGSNSHLNIKYS